MRLATVGLHLYLEATPEMMVEWDILKALNEAALTRARYFPAIVIHLLKYLYNLYYHLNVKYVSNYNSHHMYDPWQREVEIGIQV